jgi:nitrate/TMAO reductase-like tetraheme cytochrome c subunit
MTRRHTVLLSVAVGVVVLLAAGGTAMWKVTATPQFCNSCHIMRPYVDAWQHSQHSKVECVACHYPPTLRETLRVKAAAATQLVKWATQTYSSKPFADVQDGSCMRSGCHAKEDLDRRGPLTFKRVTRFAHALHLDSGRTGWQLRCTSCHVQLMVEKHFEVAASTCFTCHFKGVKTERDVAPLAGCVGCHQAPGAGILVGRARFDHGEVVQRGVGCQSCHLNVVQGDGDAPTERCVSCHNQREKLEKSRDVKLIHAAHVTTRSISCVRCHNEIAHRLTPLPGPPIAAVSTSAGARP